MNRVGELLQSWTTLQFFAAGLWLKCPSACSSGLSTNRLVTRTLLSALFLHHKTARTGVSALRKAPSGSWPRCATARPWKLSVNRLGRATIAELINSAILSASGSWPQLPINREVTRLSKVESAAIARAVSTLESRATFMAPTRVQAWRLNLPMNRIGRAIIAELISSAMFLTSGSWGGAAATEWIRLSFIRSAGARPWPAAATAPRDGPQTPPRDAACPRGRVPRTIPAGPAPPTAPARSCPLGDGAA